MTSECATGRLALDRERRLPEGYWQLNPRYNMRVDARSAEFFQMARETIRADLCGNCWTSCSLG